MTSKRTREDVHTRLEELRSKVPRKETTLQRLMNEFNECTVKPASRSDWKKAKQKLDEVRQECIRVYAKPIWSVPVVYDVLREKVKEFRVVAMERNMDRCFELLEQHVQNRLMVGVGCYKEMSIAEFDISEEEVFNWELSKRFTTLSSNWDFDDGVRYDVFVVKNAHGSYGCGKYYASNATNEEMGSPKYPDCASIESVTLPRYMEICLRNPNVHRKDTLFQCVFDTLEAHIKTLQHNLETIDDHLFEQMVTDLHDFLLDD